MCGAVFRSSRLTRVSRGSAGSCTNNVATARRCRGRHAPPMSVNLSRGPLLRPGRSCPQRRHRWYRWLPSFHATTNLCIPSLHCQGVSFMLSFPDECATQTGLFPSDDRVRAARRWPTTPPGSSRSRRTGKELSSDDASEFERPDLAMCGCEDRGPQLQRVPARPARVAHRACWFQVWMSDLSCASGGRPVLTVFVFPQ